MAMRNPEGEGPRGPSGEPRKWSPMDRPDWWTREQKIPWYRQISRKKFYWTIAFIATLHILAALAFMQDVKMDPIDSLRRRQKTVVTYSLLPVCPENAIINRLFPRTDLTPPPGITARNLTGSVGLGLKLNANGTVQDVCLKQRSVDDGFDAAIFAAARNWVFAPPQDSNNYQLVRFTFDDATKPGKIEKFSIDTKKSMPPQDQKYDG
jgi:TonB family protein